MTKRRNVVPKPPAKPQRKKPPAKPQRKKPPAKRLKRMLLDAPQRMQLERPLKRRLVDELKSKLASVKLRMLKLVARLKRPLG